MKLFDAIYHIEQWQLGSDFEHIGDQDLIKVSGYLIMNVIPEHNIPGNVWYQIIGIMDWYGQNQFITDKQRYWLMANLNQYLDQRNLINEVF